MSTLRFALSAFSVVALGAGFLASQAAFWTGRAPEYAASVDVPPVRLVAAALLVAGIALSFVKDKSKESNGS